MAPLSFLQAGCPSCRPTNSVKALKAKSTEASTRKVKQIWILLKQETASGSGTSWAICKSASRSRQITMPASHPSFFTDRMPFLPPNQQCHSDQTECSFLPQLPKFFTLCYQQLYGECSALLAQIVYHTLQPYSIFPKDLSLL